MVVSAPTGSGKTGVVELALLRMLSKQLEPGGHQLSSRRGGAKAVYLAPLRALVQERMSDWGARFGARLGLRCLELSGDTEPDHREIESADIICSTPEKFDRWDGTHTITPQPAIRPARPALWLGIACTRMPHAHTCPGLLDAWQDQGRSSSQRVGSHIRTAPPGEA